jgi:hypothetical protein
MVYGIWYMVYGIWYSGGGQGAAVVAVVVSKEGRMEDGGGKERGEGVQRGQE